MAFGSFVIWTLRAHQTPQHIYAGPCCSLLTGSSISISHLSDCNIFHHLTTMSTARREDVSFYSRALKLAAHFYHPVEGSPDTKGAAIVICHPWTSIKEQSPANYARVLTQAGFRCLAYDAAYQGESEGQPRDLEDPYQRVEDIKAAVTYLVSRPDVDSEKVGVLGICASGGYAPFAAQTDLRIKAVATAAAVDVGVMARRGFDKNSSNMDILKTQLEAAAADRNGDVTGAKVPIVHLLPETFDPQNPPEGMPDSFKDLADFYRTPKGHHPRAINASIPRSWDLMGNFDALLHNDMISPRPLLMITGTKAATKWYSEDGIAQAKEPKELYVIEGLTHADLYYKVDDSGAKCAKFFTKYLV